MKKLSSYFAVIAIISALTLTLSSCEQTAPTSDCSLFGTWEYQTYVSEISTTVILEIDDHNKKFNRNKECITTFSDIQYTTKYDIYKNVYVTLPNIITKDTLSIVKGDEDYIRFYSDVMSPEYDEWWTYKIENDKLIMQQVGDDFGYRVYKKVK